ncbi:MAG: hypothetical protein MMC33_006556 [Icmadophila ericetorum]|nr:hypothetical protein [Icmadophila ericetorum]
MEASFKLDEGYSEDTRSQEESDSQMVVEERAGDMMAMPMPLVHSLPDFVLALSEAERLEYAYHVMRTLRTSSIATIVERLRPFLHIDPVGKLPPEITSEIFSYLAPAMLLEASKVSRAWRESTLDSRLWKQKFMAEGWSLNMNEIRRYERGEPQQGTPRKTRSQGSENPAGHQNKKKRARNNDDRDMAMISPREAPGRSMRPHDTQSWNDQYGKVEVDDEECGAAVNQTQDAEMDDVGSQSARGTTDWVFGGVESASSNLSIDMANFGSTPQSSPIKREPTFALPSASQFRKLNFHQVYRQKRKLEENWAAGRYKSFQLPHRDHPEEAHKECVYTIQYSGKYLVSGSRDKTLRIWDLETQRLVRKPLIGHSGSVLCLQFDDSEKEDIIASGSSDTDVILWKFSTGEIIKKLSKAHRESVLNLKFDERFLVTCSKDKTIKIWNRQELRPGDKNYPVRNVRGGGRCPSFVLDLSSFPTPSAMQEALNAKQMEPIAKYTHIMTLDSHGAAVNAIYIYKEQLVSASGDRTLKVFNIHSGVCTAVCSGHTKGIACVQYDGKRIVSGSSDNTIRIYDPATQAEVACLQGHSHLVRTIQVAFGDTPGENLEEEARAVDEKYFEARRSGTIPTSSVPSRRNRERNAGSSDPKDIMAYGAKLPPGGGGSRWGRIVSGSYDESVIIWKKAPDGRWVVDHKLKQAEALRAAGGQIMAQSEHLRLQAQQQAAAQAVHVQQQGAQSAATSAATQQIGAQSQNSPAPVLDQLQAHMSTQLNLQNGVASGIHAMLQAGQHTLPATPAAQAAGNLMGNQNAASTASTHIHVQTHSHTHSQWHFQNQPASSAQQPIQNQTQPAPNSTSVHVGQLPAHIQPQQLTQALQDYQSQASGINHHHHHHHHHNTATGSSQNASASPSMQTPGQIAGTGPVFLPPHPNFHTQNLIQQAHAQAQFQLQPMIQQTGHHAGVHHAGGPPQSQPNARVFKLQFDARRIICCSQDPKIVGWDFANGNEDIIECSRFFGTPT